MEQILQEANIKRAATPILHSVNPLGYILALLFLEKQQFLNKEHEMEPIAEFVSDDQQFGDHVRLTVRHLVGEEEGALSTRNVIVHNAPKDIRDFVVRFVNYSKDDEVITYRLSDVASLKVAAINYLTTGDIHPAID